ncbi:CcdC family protein [Staphylococcus sp. NAM3COL9]|uniref:CcdC family protein n=1 Tax=Staphylococcus sp. NAM3COL9 TaxID=1667172 RepID=UPI00070C8365|nr:CcdC protein domain-containing protein [Staphylococcus sp. NAM3COL9]KRG10079.1 cytochrome C biogenesis protein CcdC [Staphylococcus sp. NAM3COL9]
MLYLVISIIFAFIMGLGAIFIRMKAQNFPVNEKKIILPPFFMATGALMYVVPYFRLTGLEIVECIILGIAFSTILIWTSKFETQGSEIYMRRSKAFPIILISLLLIRTLLKIFISNKIDPGEIGGMFFLLGFSMIVPWRLAMLYKYKKLKSTLIQ